jgi:hypothetical protein
MQQRLDGADHQYDAGDSLRRGRGLLPDVREWTLPTRQLVGIVASDDDRPFRITFAKGAGDVLEVTAIERGYRRQAGCFPDGRDRRDALSDHQRRAGLQLTSAWCMDPPIAPGASPA